VKVCPLNVNIKAYVAYRLKKRAEERQGQTERFRYSYVVGTTRNRLFLFSVQVLCMRVMVLIIEGLRSRLTLVAGRHRSSGFVASQQASLAWSDNPG